MNFDKTCVETFIFLMFACFPFPFLSPIAFIAIGGPRFGEKLVEIGLGCPHVNHLHNIFKIPFTTEILEVRCGNPVLNIHC